MLTRAHINGEIQFLVIALLGLFVAINGESVEYFGLVLLYIPFALIGVIPMIMMVGGILDGLRSIFDPDGSRKPDRTFKDAFPAWTLLIVSVVGVLWGKHEFTFQYFDIAVAVVSGALFFPLSIAIFIIRDEDRRQGKKRRKLSESFKDWFSLGRRFAPQFHTKAN